MVVGSAEPEYAGIEAFRWTQSGGMEPMGDLEGDLYALAANGVSADGLVIVGRGHTYSEGTYIGREAFRWTQSGGLVALGDLPGGALYSAANAVSADGSVIVGHAETALGEEAFRWTQSGGMVSLGVLPGGVYRSFANGVSADGSVVVGGSGGKAFRWTEADGMIGLGSLPGGSDTSMAADVSADGSVVIGSSYSASGYEGFLWTETGGMVGLGDLPGGNFFSSALATSEDGSVIVGRSMTGNGSEVFVWDAENGMQLLQDILEEGGVDMSGWTLEMAYDVSSDGKKIVGYGDHNGNTEAFIAVIPEPASIGLLGLMSGGSFS